MSHLVDRSPRHYARRLNQRHEAKPSGSADAPRPFRRLAPSEYLGKKGRSLPGSHRPHGFMAMAGPSVLAAGEIDAHIADLSATLLSRLGVSVPSSFCGRVLWEALADDRSTPTEHLPEVTQVRRRLPEDRGVIESRLRALGYIE